MIIVGSFVSTTLAVQPGTGWYSAPANGVFVGRSISTLTVPAFSC
jgi:hypothetical protein